MPTCTPCSSKWASRTGASNPDGIIWPMTPARSLITASPTARILGRRYSTAELAPSSLATTPDISQLPVWQQKLRLGRADRHRRIGAGRLGDPPRHSQIAGVAEEAEGGAAADQAAAALEHRGFK